MKTTPTIILTRLLILLSIGLLILFQIFWIKKSYNEQLTLLQKQSDNLFQETVRSLTDSLSNAQMKELFKDVTIPKNRIIAKSNPQKIPKRKKISIKDDASFSIKNISFKISGIDTTDKTKVDSIMGQFITDLTGSNSASIPVKSQKEPISASLNSNKMSISIQKVGDTKPPKALFFYYEELDTTLVQKKYIKLLNNNNLPTDFKLIRLSKKQLLTTPDTLVKSEVQVAFPFGNRLVINFKNYKSYLWKQLLPQVFFAIFLVLLTSVAFGMMYQNWQQQHRLTILKNDFIGNVTHELKTPIATVSVALEALQNFNALQDPQRTQEYLAMSQQELGRLSLLIDKILKINVFEGKFIDLKLENIDLKILIENTLKSLTLQFQKQQAQVIFNTEGQDFSLRADASHLTSVIYNLIDNALKYSPKDPKIVIDLVQKNQKLHITIADNGMGIAPEFQAKIFDKFFRVPTGNHHDIKGYGLGLSYVAEVIKQHGGRIEVESEIGVGTKFMIII
jgi:two-component system, OmpR family, phosphate regulon sensor histidine kinase PhoR